MNSNTHQLRDYIRKFIINEERSNVETLKKWIMNLKQLEKRVEKVPRNDIRRYMIVQEFIKMQKLKGKNIA